MVPPLKVSSVYRALMAVATSPVDIVDYMWPVELTSHDVVHAMLAGASRQSWIMSQVERVWSDRVWFHGLCGSVEGRGANQDAMKIVCVTRSRCPTMPVTCRQRVSLAC